MPAQTSPPDPGPDIRPLLMTVAARAPLMTAGLAGALAAEVMARPDRCADLEPERAFLADLDWLLDRIAEVPTPAQAARARLSLGQGRRVCFVPGDGGGVRLQIRGLAPTPGARLDLTTTGGWLGGFTMNLPLCRLDGAAIAVFTQGTLAILCPRATARVTARLVGPKGRAGAGVEGAVLLFRLDRFGQVVVPQPFILCGGLPPATDGTRP